MAQRANWKGYLKIAELTCPVALHTAASTSDRIAFHMLNRDTGNRLRREFVDAESGEVVERDDQVKGYETDRNEHVILEPDEIASVVPESDKTLAVDAFVPCDGIDDVYLDKPYYLSPSDKPAEEAYALIRDGLKAKGVAAIARAVLFRRVRTLLVRADGDLLVAYTMNFDYEVRAADDAFSDVPKLAIKGEMMDLARHIIETKRGAFDPKAYDDRYEAALAELVKAKIDGKPLPKAKPAKAAKVIDLMEALRMSAGDGKAPEASKSSPAKSKTRAAPAKRPAAERRKAG